MKMSVAQKRELSGSRRLIMFDPGDGICFEVGRVVIYRSFSEVAVQISVLSWSRKQWMVKQALRLDVTLGMWIAKDTFKARRN